MPGRDEGAMPYVLERLTVQRKKTLVQRASATRIPPQGPYPRIRALSSGADHATVITSDDHDGRTWPTVGQVFRKGRAAFFARVLDIDEQAALIR